MANREEAMESKREVEELLVAIVADGGFNVAKLGKLETALEGMNLMMIPVAVPAEFKCPISKKLMKDPVTLSTGETYDRSSVEEWVRSGNTTCPNSGKRASTTLIPNHLLHDMITCKNPIEKSEEGWDLATILRGIKLEESRENQELYGQRLRQLTERSVSVRNEFSESVDFVTTLLEVLCTTHADLQGNIICSITNICTKDDAIKHHVAKNGTVIKLLCDLVYSPLTTTEVKTIAAGALKTLPILDSNKSLISRYGAWEGLVDMMQGGCVLAAKEASFALLNLLSKNQEEAVKRGIVEAVVTKLRNGVEDEILEILFLLSTNEKALARMVTFDTVNCLFKIIRDNDDSPHIVEKCVSILHAICCTDHDTWLWMRTEQAGHGTLTHIMEVGTCRAKMKANGINERLYTVFRKLNEREATQAARNQ